MKTDLISVVVPVYNGEAYISNMIKALKAQTYCNFEALIINDGSSDDTASICQREIGDDSRFVLVDKQNTGPSDTRNEGLSRSSGKYIAFVDADDYIFPDYLEYLYKLIYKYGADMACCEYQKVLAGEKIPKLENDSKEYVFEQLDALKTMYRKRYINGYPVLKLFKKSTLEGLSFPSEISYAEDIVFVDQVIKRCKKVAYGSKVLYIYYQNEASLTHSVDIDKLKKAWLYHMDYFTNKSVTQYPKLYDAVVCKQFVMGMDICSRIYRQDQLFRKQLISYIREVRANVAGNSENARIHRILAGLCCISTNGTVILCRLFIWLKNVFKFQIKKAI